MSPNILAAAIVLARIHGAQYAAHFLAERGIDVSIAVELLTERTKKSIHNTCDPVSEQIHSAS